MFFKEWSHKIWLLILLVGPFNNQRNDARKCGVFIVSSNSHLSLKFRNNAWLVLVSDMSWDSNECPQGREEEKQKCFNCCSTFHVSMSRSRKLVINSCALYGLLPFTSHVKQWDIVVNLFIFTAFFRVRRKHPKVSLFTLRLFPFCYEENITLLSIHDVHL